MGNSGDTTLNYMLHDPMLQAQFSRERNRDINNCPATRGTRLIPNISIIPLNPGWAILRTEDRIGTYNVIRRRTVHNASAPQMKGLRIIALLKIPELLSRILKTCHSWAKASVRNETRF
jgi:hypothetical protein